MQPWKEFQQNEFQKKYKLNNSIKDLEWAKLVLVRIKYLLESLILAQDERWRRA